MKYLKLTKTHRPPNGHEKIGTDYIELRDGSPLDAHTVEVYGNNPTKAIRAALDEIKEDQGEDCRPLAVFEGHLRNVICEAPAFCR